MPLYFPRSKEEEDYVLNKLPDDIGELIFTFLFMHILMHASLKFCTLMANGMLVAQQTSMCVPDYQTGSFSSPAKGSSVFLRWLRHPS